MNTPPKQILRCATAILVFFFAAATAHAQLSLTFTVTPPLCGGFSTGSITANVTGGSAPYSFLWSTGDTLNPVSHLPAGTYAVTVVDQDSLLAVDSVVMTGPPPIAVPIVVDTCEVPGAMTAYPEGGTPPLSLVWNTGDTVPHLTNLSIGQYCLTVVDQNNCAFLNCQYIGAPLSATVATTEATCNDPTGGGSAKASVTGGVFPFKYKWSNGMTGVEIDSLPAGVYTVTVRAYNGCTATATDTVHLLEEPLLLNMLGENPICEGDSTGAAKAEAPGGFLPLTYFWSTGDSSQSITDLPAGAYNVTVADAMGCIGEDSVQLTYESHLGVSLLAEDPHCFGENNGTISAIANDGVSPYTYLWSTGDTTVTIDQLGPGSYAVAVTDSLGCVAAGTATLQWPQPMALAFAVAHASHCAAKDGSIEVQVSGGGTPPFQFHWNNGASTNPLGSLPAGMYALTVTSAEGCEIVDSAAVLQPNNLNISITGTSLVCGNSTSGTLTAHPVYGTAPYQYIWSNGQTTKTISGLGPGVYTVTITSAEGCAGQAAKTIFNSPGIDLNLQHQPISCAGADDGSLTAIASGGLPPLSILWNTGQGSSTISGLGPGTYQVTVTDFAGCTVSASYTLEAPPPLTTALDASPGLCGAAAAVSALPAGGTQPYSYQWNQGATSQTISTTVSGDLSVTVTDAHGCTTTASVFVPNFPGIELALAAQGTTCAGIADGVVTSNVSGGTPPFSFLWSDGSTGISLDGVFPGSYSLTVTDAVGCTREEAAEVFAGPALAVSVSAPAWLCEGSSVEAAAITGPGGHPPLAFEWSTGQQTPTIDIANPGMYSVTVEDAMGCTGSGSAFVVAAGNFQLNTLAQPASCFGFADGWVEVTLVGGTPPFAVNWPDGANAWLRNDLPAGAYTAVVTEMSSGCSKQIELFVTEPPMLDAVLSVENGLCGNPGVAQVEATGGTPPYGYLWNTGETAPVLFANTTGDFVLQTTDANSCTRLDTVSIQVASQPECVVALLSYPFSSDSLSGQLEVSYQHLNAPVDMTWSNGQTGSTASELGPGTYTATLLDANGCLTSCDISIPEFAVLGDRVWQDEDQDGIQDQGESGIPGVKVRITGTNYAQQSLARETFTDLNGQYRFELPPGTYQLFFEKPDSHAVSPPFQGSDPAVDSDVSPLDAATPVFALAEAEQLLGYDAGFFKVSSCQNVSDGGSICCNQKLCAPGQVAATITEATPPAGGSGSLEFAWAFSEGSDVYGQGTWQSISGAGQPSLEPGAMLRNTWLVRLTRRSGCADFQASNAVAIVVEDVPDASIEGPDMVCIDRQYAFEAGPAAEATFSWEFGGSASPSATAGQTIPSVYWTSTGTYWVTLTVKWNDCSDRDSLLVRVTDDAALCEDPFLATGEIVGPTSALIRWQWPNDSLLGTSFELEWTVPGEAFTALSPPDSNWQSGMVRQFEGLHQNASAGINYYRVRADKGGVVHRYSNVVTLHFQNGGRFLLVFPNPFSDYLDLQVIDRYNADIEVELLGSDGRHIAKRKLADDENELRLPTDYLPKGMYFLKIRYNRELVQVAKLVKH